MERFGATGGANKASYKCSFANVVEMERVDATGGASSSPTKSGRDSAVLEGLVRGERWCCNPSVLRQIRLSKY